MYKGSLLCLNNIAMSHCVFSKHKNAISLCNYAWFCLKCSQYLHTFSTGRDWQSIGNPSLSCPGCYSWSQKDRLSFDEKSAYLSS